MNNNDNLRRRFLRRWRPGTSPGVSLSRPCPECGRIIGRDLGCRYCATVREFWHLCQRENPELSRELCILVGSLVAGMNEAFVEEHGRGRRIPMEPEFEHAVDLAATFMKSMGYVLPKVEAARARRARKDGKT